jgi:predicted ribosome quality control (RQC) complex YloA/Tae2 family protein
VSRGESSNVYRGKSGSVTTNYFVLAALSREWNGLLRGAKFADAYSYLPNELSLVFDTSKTGLLAIRASTRPGNTFVYSQDNPGRPKSNITSLFEDAADRMVSHVSIAEGDRIVSISFDGGSRLELHPYGSRANVYLVGPPEEGAIITAAFKRSEALVGQSPPGARELASSPILEDRRLGAYFVPEARHRSPENPEVGLKSVLSDLADPTPVLYEVDDKLLFSPIELLHLGLSPVESFNSVGDGVRWVIKTRSRRHRFKEGGQKLSAALEKAASRWARRVGELEKAMASESRADRYEVWGHLLMSNPAAETVGSDEISVPNILGDGATITIPLDPRKTVIQNAERYYERARKTREEREHLEARLDDARTNQNEAAALLSELGNAKTIKDIEQFQKRRADDLRRFVGGKTEAIASAPFRRFGIDGGYEVWVGRSAKENDLLTFEHAARHDLWMHARGTPGSHAVLRVPGRTQQVDQRTKMIAASIAAWFSSARGSALVPVQVTQRKYVTKPRGAAPGAVRVQNEEVLLVEPGLPKSRS